MLCSGRALGVTLVLVLSLKMRVILEDRNQVEDDLQLLLSAKQNSGNGSKPFLLVHPPKTLLSPWSTMRKPSVQATGNVRTEILLLILTKPENTKRRENLRNLKCEGYHLKMVFVVGVASRISQNQLDKENKTYGDILQLDIPESYSGLPLKTVNGFRFLHQTFGEEDQVVIKLDDDLKINKDVLRQRILDYERIGGGLYCLPLINTKPSRDETGPLKKLFVDVTQWSESHYPSFCLGWIYMLTPKIIHLLLHQIEDSPYVHIDDLYITGILRTSAHVEIIPLPVPPVVSAVERWSIR